MKRFVFLMLAGLLLSGARGLAAPAPTPDTEEKEGTIAGTPIQRPQGGWLGLEIKDNSFVLTFYNAKKKPIPADKTSAILRWAVRYQPNAERTELTPTSDPAVFTSSYSVKPPHTFILHISLLSDPKDNPESYTIEYSG
jgi:hypothetical protein